MLRASRAIAVNSDHRTQRSHAAVERLVDNTTYTVLVVLYKLTSTRLVRAGTPRVATAAFCERSPRRRRAEPATGVRRVVSGRAAVRKAGRRAARARAAWARAPLRRRERRAAAGAGGGECARQLGRKARGPRLPFACLSLSPAMAQRNLMK